MFKLVKDFLKEEDGMGVIEIVIIIAVLVALALVFKKAIGEFANKLMEKFFDSSKINNDMQGPTLK